MHLAEVESLWGVRDVGMWSARSKGRGLAGVVNANDVWCERERAEGVLIRGVVFVGAGRRVCCVWNCGERCESRSEAVPAGGRELYVAAASQECWRRYFRHPWQWRIGCRRVEGRAF